MILRRISRHPYTLVDVFTDTPLAGNALAVVHAADGVSEETMLRFARETRLSETTFVQSPEEDADYRNRIWTITEEVPFAGHPSLGTAVAVALERDETSAAYRQQTRVGVQPVTVERDGDRARASILQPPAEFGAEIRREELLPALGLTVRDGAPGPCRIVSTGLPALMVPLRDRRTLARARYDHPALAAVVPGGANVYLFAPDGDDVRARMFVTVGPEGEDPATGSAAGPLLAHLHEQDGRDVLTIRQGVEMGRASRLDCTLADGRVRVAGDVVVVATGTLRLP